MTIQGSFLVDGGGVGVGGIGGIGGIDEATSNQKPQSLDSTLKQIISQDKTEIEANEHAFMESGFEQSPCIQREPCGYFVRLSKKWPRLFAIIFKVVMPLLSLIVLSMMFGYLLAQMEAPGEIEKNNISIAINEALFRFAELERVIMREGPLFCVQLFFEVDLRNIRGSIEEYMLDNLDEINSRLGNDLPDGEKNITHFSKNVALANITSLLDTHNVTKIDDIPRFLQFMEYCGNEIDRLVNHSSVSTVINFDAMYQIDDNAVSFNWIRCPDDDSHKNEPFANNKGGVWRAFSETLRSSNAGLQEKAATMRWVKQHRIAYAEYYNKYKKNPNITRLQARDKASLDAVRKADGFEKCVPDINAAAWFWFTVMTTVGYGNASPTTMGGRALVWTFGFICILIFGIVLATAGDIVTTIFNDAVTRYRRLKWLSVTWVAIIFWGVSFYLWLLALAAITVGWKKSRAGQDLKIADAYWFAFISITTVGLGDFILEPETITVYEVIYFAFLFLVGFVLLANFLCMLSEFLQSLGRHNRHTFSARLEDTPPLPLPKDSDE